MAERKEAEVEIDRKLSRIIACGYEATTGEEQPRTSLAKMPNAHCSNAKKSQCPSWELKTGTPGIGIWDFFGVWSFVAEG